MIKLIDFGLSRRLVEVTNTQNKLVGLISYIDPQLFKNQSNSNYNYKKSDVYSVGVLLWEISSGRKPFESYNDDFQRIALISEILNGKRETPIYDTPSDYINIYTKCWKDNPDDRSDMEQVFSELKLINLNIIEDNAMELDEDPNNNKVIINIINELLLLHDKFIQIRKCEESYYIQLAKSYIASENKDEEEIFNYLLDNMDVLQNIFLLAIFFHYGIGTNKNEIEAFDLYKEAAIKGNIDSIQQLGLCYQYGIGTKENKIKAFELYEKAAEKGSISSINQLGICYQDGIGTKENRIKAFELYKKAAEKGNISSINHLGTCYMNGIGTEENKIKAFELYKEAAEKDDIVAMNKLACCYQYGIGTEKNEIKASELYKLCEEAFGIIQ
ncbi:hypothetical protein GLOIN_2v816085 [Rhizophagus irregularis DAOM 181602=DAOM 197198]|uniref:Shc1p n=3 Tax=Rhizophagus irregularis TaxID=588596 RepID=A0A015LTG6_RHIIW|nr:hypothetical protein GLOIN_2v816085 [Rhizophagus irregularis DAOM 181602=DAOM 197198]EXX57993.1 Shc1p [Rhizophagus irregularis DAOM 197198w]POG59916.1 hypothetical protein GLOIN_2v816085 [Rhizophagus irregularis DAOM 181602=DAOM 197198]|eukprot:XP_025166782.1 hypothetical protein GLOIN_2v816085 [Rhizophagus irregularis DAOM 181602=DAOM 197198]